MSITYVSLVITGVYSGFFFFYVFFPVDPSNTPSSRKLVERVDSDKFVGDGRWELKMYFYNDPLSSRSFFLIFSFRVKYSFFLFFSLPSSLPNSLK